MKKNDVIPVSRVSVRADHGFPPAIDSTSQILILGSFPSVRSRAENFFYMHPRNRFWPMMNGIFGDVPIEKKPLILREWLRKHHLALYDVIESCVIQGSSDASVRDVVLADIRSLIDQAPIHRILLNGKTASRWFLKGFPEFIPLAISLPSTSPAHAGMDLAELQERWRPYLELDPEKRGRLQK
jgi:hypoxanthine-DNA glycosylase